MRGLPLGVPKPMVSSMAAGAPLAVTWVEVAGQLEADQPVQRRPHDLGHLLGTGHLQDTGVHGGAHG
nr:hypothetical protein [Actinacidiphila soli]